MTMERNRPLDPTLKFIDSSDIYETIKKCNSKILRITYCSLTLNGQCMNIKTIDMKIKKIYPNSEFIEGTQLINNEPVEDIIMKASVVLKIECVQGSKPDETLSIYDKIKYCNGIVKITQCTKLEQGKCVRKTSFPFVVTDMDKKNKVIKGYQIKNNTTPQYMVLDDSLILDVDCINKKNMPDFPWWIIPGILNNIKK